MTARWICKVGFANLDDSMERVVKAGAQPPSYEGGGYYSPVHKAQYVELEFSFKSRVVMEAARARLLKLSDVRGLNVRCKIGG